jgi:hypothetical protein
VEAAEGQHEGRAAGPVLEVFDARAVEGRFDALLLLLPLLLVQRVRRCALCGERRCGVDGAGLKLEWCTRSRAAPLHAAMEAHQTTLLSQSQ